MMWTLITKTWRDQRRALLAWSLGLVTICSVQLWIYPTIKKSGAGIGQLIDAFPDALKQIFRMQDYTSGPGYLTTELFSLMLPLIMIAVGASTGARATAQDEEDGTADLLLTLPITRRRVLASKVLATLVIFIGIGLLTFLTIYIGARLVDLKVPTSNLAAGAVTCASLGFLFSALACLAGTISGRRATSLGMVIGFALAMYLVFSLAPLVDTFDLVTPLNPFEWALGKSPVFNGWDVPGVMKLLILSAALYTSAFFTFDRRDIRA